MKTLVVYDSLYGNTEQIARAVAQSLGEQGEVQALRVGDVKPEHLHGLDLLVAGAPTHGFRPSPPLKEWLKNLAPHSLDGLKVAAFDTRISPADANSAILSMFVRLFGYAAEPIGRSLAKAGGSLILPPEGFIVKGKEGPLKEGELERAAAWGSKVAGAATKAGR